LGFDGATDIEDPAKALELDCDLLVPAALENQIRGDNVSRVRARVIAEAANGPVTPEADAALRARGVLILPDIYLNAGGVTVSYFEWLKNLQHVSFERMTKRWDERMYEHFCEALEELTGKRVPEPERRNMVRGPDERELVLSALENTMVFAFDVLTRTMATRKAPDLRTAAFVLALEKVARIYAAAGIFP
jgi:glutamate dehydrogenase (NAD(P)+)